MSFLDLFSAQSSLYARFRPEYPPALFAYLASLVPGHSRACDCATGSGQAAGRLADHFDHVLACDASASQLAHAQPCPRVTYLCSAAETLPLPAAALDLLTVAQAVHWFDLDRFYAEARRVLRPGGILALWGYHLLQTSPDVDALVGRFFYQITAPYWHPNRRLIDELYRTLPFPFSDLTAPALEISTEWRLNDLVGFLSSWSAVQAFQKAQNYHPLREIEAELLDAWGDPQRARVVRWPLFFRIARMQAEA